MKTGSLILALCLAAAPLGAQELIPRAIDSASAYAARETSAEAQHGGGHEACGAHVEREAAAGRCHSCPQ